MKNPVHFTSGTENKIAFVFSCPGKEERDAKPQGPAKGQTGTNLNRLIGLLSEVDRFKGLRRDKVTITNSWDKVEFKEATGRTEASIPEVLSAKNLNRLAKEIENIEEIVFACGKNAQAALLKLKTDKKLNLKVKVFNLRHLGNRSISQIKVDKHGRKIDCYKKASNKPPSETRSLVAIRKANVDRRFEKIVFDLLSDIEKGKEWE